jgi:hypothetical protein
MSSVSIVQPAVDMLHVASVNIVQRAAAAVHMTSVNIVQRVQTCCMWHQATLCMHAAVMHVLATMCHSVKCLPRHIAL